MNLVPQRPRPFEPGRWVAEMHSSTWRCRTVTELRQPEQVRVREDEAARRTASNLADLRAHLLQQGLTEKQAHERA